MNLYIYIYVCVCVFVCVRVFTVIYSYIIVFNMHVYNVIQNIGIPGILLGRYEGDTYAGM